MPLDWLKKKLQQRTSTVVTEPGESRGTAEAPSDLRFTEAPSSIHRFVATADYQQAMQILEDEHAGAPEPETVFWLIRCLTELGQLKKALEATESALDRYPDIADFYLAQAEILRQEGKNAECREALSMAQHYAPASTKVLNFLGDLSLQEKDSEEAIENYADSLRLHYSVDTAKLLAKAYSDANRFDESEQIVREALEKSPDDYQLLGRLGRLLTVTDRYEEAIEIQRRLADLPVVDTQIYADLTYVHYCLGELDQAQYYVGKILSIEPANYNARYYLGLIQLAKGDFSQAWDNYSWRMLASMVHGPRFAFPEWNGVTSADRTLLIFAEQGLGDQIMFCGCVPQVLSAGQKVLLECDERLTGLYQRSFPEARVAPWAKYSKLKWTEDAGNIDYQIAMGDLPGLYRRSADAFPDHGGYLKADPEKVARWRKRLSDLGDDCWIGISWRGGTVKSRRSIRSIEPEDWGPLLAIPNAHFVSLQYGEVDEDIKAFTEAHGIQVHHWQEAIDDYDETAALIAAMDGVATVCTAVAHLTGALGQRGWVATPVIPEWRYMTGGEHWLWYPQMALVRQEKLGDWHDVMETITHQVSTLCRVHH